MRRKAIFGALLLIALGVLLGGTVFRDQIANAKSLAQSVFVSNTSANPVPVTSADDPGRQAFAFFKSDSFGPDEDSHHVSFTVPAGKRLVIESVSVNGLVDTGTGQKIVDAGVQAQVNGQLEDYIMAPQFTGTSSSADDVYTVSQPTTIYADSGTDVLVFTARNTFNGGAIMNVSVQGHLINCSVATCN